jgi:hypothetical protein
MYLILRSLLVSLITDLVSLLYIDRFAIAGEGWICNCLGLPRTPFCYFNLLKDGNAENSSGFTYGL